MLRSSKVSATLPCERVRVCPKARWRGLAHLGLGPVLDTLLRALLRPPPPLAALPSPLPGLNTPLNPPPPPGLADGGPLGLNPTPLTGLRPAPGSG